jgi:hypothetical protein
LLPDWSSDLQRSNPTARPRGTSFATMAK